MRAKLLSAVVPCALAAIAAALSCQDRGGQLPRLQRDTSYVALLERAKNFIPDTGTHGGTLTCALQYEPPSLNPVTAADPLSRVLSSLMFEGLVKIIPATGLPQPNLAQSWECSADGRVWTFRLRPGACWSDGKRFSAHDVDFTFNDILFNDSIGREGHRQAFLASADHFKVTALDSATVEVTLFAPSPVLLYRMSQPILPRHRYHRYVRNGSFARTLSVHTPPDSLAATGPFILARCVPAQQLVFKRNPRYWKTDTAGSHLPYLDSLVFKICADRYAETGWFFGGDIDYLAASTDDYPDLAWNQAEYEYTLVRLGPARGSNFLVFNQNTGRDSTGKPYRDPAKTSWFRNELFRKAIAHAIAKDSIIASALGGLGYAQWSPLSPADGHFHSADACRYPYDLKKAGRLLAEADFADTDKDGMLEDILGNRIEFTILTNQGNMFREKTATLICSDLLSLGLNVSFEQIPFKELQDRLFSPPYNWDAAIPGTAGEIDPQFCANIWKSGSRMHLWDPSQKTPRTPWEASIDSIFVAAARQSDPGARKRLFDRWQVIASDKLPLIFTVLPERILCVRASIGNVCPTPFGGLLGSVEYLYIRK
jgi:peptide/nickel transport system substrate-binding protein